MAITSVPATARFLIYSGIGVVAFFVPFTINSRSTILLDHMIIFASTQFVYVSYLYCIVLIAWGVGSPFWSGRWRNSRTTAVIALLQVLAIPLVAMFLLDRGPDAIMQSDMLPFLFTKLAVPVGLIIPVGSLFLAFLVGFGLLEAIGVLMERVMQPVWKTPGRSAVDAVASFAGSYSVGLILTNKVYQAGRYSAKEAAVIATGFSTVSAAFMIVVAKTLLLTDNWNAYFWSTLFVTFTVTAITVRLPPLSGFDNTRAIGLDDVEGAPDVESTGKKAWREGMLMAHSAPPIARLLWENFLDGLAMATRVVPSILSIGMLGLLLAKYTPVFDILGYLLYPVVWASQLDHPGQISSALASGLAEMFLPAIQSTDFSAPARFTIGVVSVSSILFFSASIPCVLATEIPISIWQMVIIWLERTLFSIPLAAVMAYFLL